MCLDHVQGNLRNRRGLVHEMTLASALLNGASSSSLLTTPCVKITSLKSTGII